MTIVPSLQDIKTIKVIRWSQPPLPAPIPFRPQV
jgi:hypothetical protein